MPNGRYGKGARLERAVVKHLKDLKYEAHRVAGSKGPFDVSATGWGKQLWIQCKTNGYVPPAEHDALLDLAAQYGTRPIIASRYPNGRGVWLREIYAHRGHSARPPLIEFDPLAGDPR